MTTFNEPITYSALAHLYVARGAVLCLPWWSWPGFGGWYLPEDQSVNRKFALYCRNCEFYDATLAWNSGNKKHRQLTDLVFSGQDHHIDGGGCYHWTPPPQLSMMCLDSVAEQFCTNKTDMVSLELVYRKEKESVSETVSASEDCLWPRLYVAQQWQWWQFLGCEYGFSRRA